MMSQGGKIDQIRIAAAGLDPGRKRVTFGLSHFRVNQLSTFVGVFITHLDQFENFRFLWLPEVDQALVSQRDKCLFVRRQNVVFQINGRQMALNTARWIG